MGDQPELEERTLECSGRIVLDCQCGDRLILLGQEEDWRSEGRSDFECGCGKNLTFADRPDEEVLAVKRLLHGVIKPPGL